MNIVVRIPDALASRLAETGANLEREALEAWAAESFRQGRMTIAELRETLSLTSVDEVDGFLKTRKIYLPYDWEDLQRDRATLDKLGV